MMKKEKRGKEGGLKRAGKSGKGCRHTDQPR